MPLGGGDVCHAFDLAGLRINFVQLAMVRLDRIQVPVNGEHAVPGAVWFEVVRLDERGGMIFLEDGQIGHDRDVAVIFDLQHGVVSVGQPMGGACSGKDGVELVPDEGHVGHAADQASLGRRSLAGRQAVG